jgi:hypothetical protein
LKSIAPRAARVTSENHDDQIHSCIHTHSIN